MSLVLSNLCKKYENNGRTTLNGINLTIEDGELICVVGQSGCGKSTLLNLIAGLEMPTAGEVLLDGEPVTAPGADRTVMFQDHGLYPWLNVIDNVSAGMKFAGIPKKEREEKALFYLGLMHLTEYRDYAIHQLSGGMRQRVALARALTMDSRILLMDEPFSALDKQTSNGLREELQRIWMETGRTIFFITHSVEEAVYLADRVVVMHPHEGKISRIYCIALERPRHVYTEEFVELRRKILEDVRGETV
ncbi:MAG: ABC transporter ATP-binding protein [Lachnospiraceae bacterium]|nr:ABC transporter ATP-binding protein [Lachnospiraceae bacterium]